MFRIIFDPREGVFRVQVFQVAWWVTVRTRDLDDKSIRCGWATLEATRAWVTKNGLSDHYREQTPMRSWLMGSNP